MPHILPDGRLLLGAEFKPRRARRRPANDDADEFTDLKTIAPLTMIGRRVATIRAMVEDGQTSAVALLLGARDGVMSQHGSMDASALAMATLHGMVASDHLRWELKRGDDRLVPGPRWNERPDHRDLDITHPAVSVNVAAMSLISDPLGCWDDDLPSVSTGALAIRLVECLATGPTLRLDRIAAQLRRESHTLPVASRPERSWIDDQLRCLALLLVDVGWVEVVRQPVRGLPTLSMNHLGRVGTMMLIATVAGDVPGPIVDVLQESGHLRAHGGFIHPADLPVAPSMN